MRKREILSKIKKLDAGERLQIVKKGQHRYCAYGGLSTSSWYEDAEDEKTIGYLDCCSREQADCYSTWSMQDLENYLADLEETYALYGII